MPKNKKWGKRGGGNGGRGREDSRADHVEKADMDNERFSSYYKAQNILPDDEWGDFMKSLRTHLPTTFRVAGSRQTVHLLNATIKDTYVPSLSHVVFEGESIPPPVQIPWYPEGLAWQFNVPKKVLRKSPEFKKFHSFLVFETEVGNISRQEAVSMLPPLFLEVEPHHRVIDMCAAPGSKTAQLLEALHAQDTVTSTSIPPGIVIANDSDNKRCHLLIHQSSRLPSPALMVTNLDASNYPGIKIPNKHSGKLEPLLFDRILCDVPCSGDGTMRKNIPIWKKWSTGDGNGLHSLQLRILQRAMNLLKEDGRIVYSTCSLNPVENEAVVAAALRSNLDFQLVDVSTSFPELIRRPGLTAWKPTDRRCTTFYATHEEYLRANASDEKAISKMSPSLWPPSDVDSLNLTRCMRLYPHLQDTGGFFVAVLQRKPRQKAPDKKRGAKDLQDLPESKKPKLNASNVATMTRAEEGASELPVAQTLQDSQEVPVVDSLEPEADARTFSETPYTFLPPNDSIVQHCIDRLHLSTLFPSSNILVRNPAGEPARSLYIANDLVKSVITHNDYARIRLHTAGTKIFTKHDGGKASEALFRVVEEGVPVVVPFMDPEFLVSGNLDDLRVLLGSYFPLCSTLQEPFRGVMEARSNGSHVMKIPADAEGSRTSHDLLLPLWKSNVSVCLMIDKKAKSALSLRMFGEDVTVSAQAKARTKGQKDAESKPEVSGADVSEQGVKKTQDGENNKSEVEDMEE